ncbi:MAG: heavy-metal-associated domain-containing protein [Clostridia bacterium]|nr:heavy-metal-associated domain-containing protein [Clostridia bacterium]
MDYIIIAILVCVLLLAVFRAMKHFRGGCCGSGGSTIRDKKTLTRPAIGRKVLTVEGMHCVNCEIRVENALNRLENAVCKVRWKKKMAVVSFSAEISDALLKETVERLGYQVTDIRSETYKA